MSIFAPLCPTNPAGLTRRSNGWEMSLSTGTVVVSLQPSGPTTTEQSALCKDITALLDASTLDNATFNTLYDRILACFEERGSSETDHGLANLALLDAHTIRSYKNAVFPIKRRHILRLDKAGMFVPLCTTNAFLKYYSSKVDKMMFWNEGDRNDYFNAIVDTLVDFFTPENGGMT